MVMSDNRFGFNILKKYGLNPMSIDAEINAPDNIRQTRMNKIQIIDDCAIIIGWANQYINTARKIPEEDDARHAALVQELSDAIHTARLTLDKAAGIGKE